MQRLFLSIVVALCAHVIYAQTFLESLQKAEGGKGKIVVIEEHEIDSLVNGKSASVTTPSKVPGATAGTATNQPGSTTNQPGTDKPNNGKEAGSSTATTTGTGEETEEAAPTIDTRKKIMRNSHRVQGFRVQVFSGGNSRNDKKKAEEAGLVMKSNFPTEPIYVHFYSPSWKCRMGNYRTLEEARAKLSAVRKLGYRQACVVKGPISVAY